MSSSKTALIYDVHGNLPALQAVIGDAMSEGATKWVLGGDNALFGAWPEATLRQLGGLRGAMWVRGNCDRWSRDHSDTPATEPVVGALAYLERELDGRDLDRLAQLPESARMRDTLAVHASPGSDLASFAPEPEPQDSELLAGVDAARLIFGHTHIQFMRQAAGSDTVLLNPGSVGMPLDGDHRAAYALLDRDGRAELRRVTYDHQMVSQQLRAIGEPWSEVIAGRIERAAT